MEQKYGEWTILKEVERDKVNDLRRFLCRCSCGTERVVRIDKLQRGESKSCGHLDYGVEKVLSGKTRSSSGVRGVHWNKKDGKWEANITVHGKRTYLGQYYEKEHAVRARQNAENELRRKLKKGKT